MNKVQFLSSHGSVLVLIAGNPLIRISELMTKLHLSERAVRRTVSDLEQAGYLSKSRQGLPVNKAITTELIDSLIAIEQLSNFRPYSSSGDTDSKRCQTESLLINAIENLTSQGLSFWELSVEQIITEAGISRSTFYLYFKDKATLLEIMLNTIMAEVLVSAKTADSLIESATKHDLEKSLKTHLEFYWPHRYILSAAIEAGHNYPEINQIYRKNLQQAIDLLTANIARKNAIAPIKTGLTAKWCALFITWGLEDCLNNFYTKAPSKSLESLSVALAETIWSLLFRDSFEDIK